MAKLEATINAFVRQMEEAEAWARSNAETRPQDALGFQIARKLAPHLFRIIDEAQTQGDEASINAGVIIAALPAGVAIPLAHALSALAWPGTAMPVARDFWATLADDTQHFASVIDANTSNLLREASTPASRQTGQDLTRSSVLDGDGASPGASPTRSGSDGEGSPPAEGLPAGSAAPGPSGRDDP